MFRKCIRPGSPVWKSSAVCGKAGSRPVPRGVTPRFALHYGPCSLKRVERLTAAYHVFYGGKNPTKAHKCFVSSPEPSPCSYVLKRFVKAYQCFFYIYNFLIS